MKKRIQNKSVQFWVTSSEKKEIIDNMKSNNGMTNLSEFLRILALSRPKITFSVNVPNVVDVSEAHLGNDVEARKESKRATG